MLTLGIQAGLRKPSSERWQRALWLTGSVEFSLFFAGMVGMETLVGLFAEGKKNDVWVTPPLFRPQLLLANFLFSK